MRRTARRGVGLLRFYVVYSLAMCPGMYYEFTSMYASPEVFGVMRSAPADLLPLLRPALLALQLYTTTTALLPFFTVMLLVLVIHDALADMYYALGGLLEVTV